MLFAMPRWRLPRRRTLVTVLVYLMCGLLLSVGVATGASLADRTRLMRLNVVGSAADGLWFIRTHSGLGLTRREAAFARDREHTGADQIQTWRGQWIVTFVGPGERSTLHIFDGRGASTEPPASHAESLDAGDTEYFETLEAGWPFRCMSGRVAGPKIEYTETFASRYSWVARTPFALRQPPGVFLLFDRLRGAVPYRPMVVGLVIDTVFWAIVLWPLSLVLRHVLPGTRRKRRIKRGLCPACGYDLSGCVQPGCPECGLRREALVAVHTADATLITPMDKADQLKSLHAQVSDDLK